MAKIALPAISMVPYVGAGIEVISLATGRDLLDGGRKMEARSASSAPACSSAWALLGVAGSKSVARSSTRSAGPKMPRRAAEAVETVAKAETDIAEGDYRGGLSS